MTSLKSILVALLFFVLMFGASSNVMAQYSSPQQYYGMTGGEITGYVLGANSLPLDWAVIYARNSQHTYEAFSGMSGVYQMRVPVGAYNVTATFPGYSASSVNVTVSDGSSSTLNFYLRVNVAVSGGSSSVINVYLDQSQVPVPEFQPNVTLIVLAFAIAATLAIRYRSRRNPVQYSQ